MNILLVEDNPGDIILAKEALKLTAEHIEPYHLDVAKDGEEALKYLFQIDGYRESAVPDIIFLDLNLPRKNGFEVLQIIKSDQTLKSIPVIVFSTSSSEFDINNSYEHKANCYVTKPVDFDDFINVMGNILTFWGEARMPVKPVAAA